MGGGRQEVARAGAHLSLRLLRPPGRIVSLSWHPSGTLLAAGMLDTIRIFDVSTGEDRTRPQVGGALVAASKWVWLCSGHASRRLLVERGTGTWKSREVVVWGLVFLSDHTIVSGDSAGNVHFWDGHMGTLIRSHPVSKWDVLALSVSQVSPSVEAETRWSSQSDGLSRSSGRTQPGGGDV